MSSSGAHSLRCSSTYARYILGHALVGYNFWFGTNMVLRPSLWVGVAIALKPEDMTGSTTETGMLLAPGLSFHYLFGNNGWYLGADVRFNQAAAVLRVPRTLPAMPVTGGDRVLREVALDYMRSHFPVPERTTAARVQRLLTQSLGSAGVDIGAIARLLQIHPRTLQRRLAAEGAAFDKILDTVRRQTAYRLITSTDVPFSQVTAMVGLTEQSALSRAVRRWFGTSPRDLRRAH